MNSAGFILVLSLIIGSPFSFAGGAGGGGGGDLEQASFGGCENGRRQQFTEHDHNDRSKTVFRTCVDGSYYPKAKPARIIKCRDGRTYREPAEREGFRSVSVTKICDSGKYVDIRSAL